MSKKFRRFLKLFLPFFIFKWRGKRFYRLSFPTVGKNAFTRLLFNCLPAFFAVPLFYVKPTDRSTLKYFLPYRVMAKYLNARYSMEFRESRSFIYSCMPYGFTLWWEQEKKRDAAWEMKCKKKEEADQRLKKANSRPKDGECTSVISKEILLEIEKMKKTMGAFDVKIDRIEVLLLRLLKNAKDEN